MRTWDRNKTCSYELARIVAAKIVEDPSLIEDGRKYLERHVKADPAQRRYYKLWSRMLELDANEIASRLMADTAEGSLLRDTRPVFCVPSNQERRAALDRARRYPKQ